MIDTALLYGSAAPWVLVLLAWLPLRFPGEPRREDPAVPAPETQDHESKVTR